MNAAPLSPAAAPGARLPFLAASARARLLRRASPAAREGRQGAPDSEEGDERADRPAGGEAAVGGRRLVLGFLDVAGSSLASFAVGVFATWRFGGELLGLYALFFTAFVLGAVIPAQLLCAPAELSVVHDAPDRQLRGVRGLAPFVALLGGAVALVAAAVIALAVGVEGRDFALLALTMMAATALSPLQDHLRRLSHQALASEVAATMSAVQAVVTLGALVALGSPSRWVAAAPFGALLCANVVSSAVGVALLRRRRLSFTGLRSSVVTLARTGRWLAGAQAAGALGAMGALLMVSLLAGVDEAGVCEAVRVLSQPVYVAGVGLLTVMNPSIYRARHNRERRAEARVRRQYKGILTLVSVATLVTFSTLNPWNPLKGWFPTAYSRPGLLEALIVGQWLVFWPQAKVSGLIADRRVAEVSKAQMTGLPLQLMVSGSAAAVGAWGYLLGLIAAAAGRIVVIGTLERRGPAPSRTGLLRNVGRAPGRVRGRVPFGEVSAMHDAHPLDEPSILGAVRRRPFLFALCVVVGLGLGALAATMSSGFVGTSTVTVADPAATSLFDTTRQFDADRYVADQVAVLSSPEVFDEAAATLRASGSWRSVDADALRDVVSIASSDGSNTLTVSATAATEDQASATVEAVLDAYVAATTAANAEEVAASKRELEAQVDAIDVELAGLDATIAALQAGAASEVRLEGAIAERNALLLERASLGTRSRELSVDLARNPSGVTRRTEVAVADGAGSVLRFPLLGVVLGAAAGTFLTYLSARRRRHFEREDEPQALLGLRYLATMPSQALAASSPAAQLRRSSALEFVATLVETESRRRQVHRFGFVSPSSSPELVAFTGSLERMLARPLPGRAQAGNAEERAAPQGNGHRDGEGVNGEARNGHGNGAPALPRRVPAAPSRAGPPSELGSGTHAEASGSDPSRLPWRGGPQRALPAPSVGEETASDGAAAVDPWHGWRAEPAMASAVPAAAGQDPAAPDSLVVIEVPQFLAAPGRAPAGDQLDGVVLLLGPSDDIAAAAEVARRVAVLGWDLLGYVYVVDRL